MKNLSPCFDCKKRVIGCHSGCKDYISWNYARIDEKVRARNAKQLEQMRSVPKIKLYDNPYSTRYL